MELLGIVSVPEGLLLLAVALVASYWFMTRKYGMWEKQGITEVRPTLVLGGLWNLLTKFSIDVEEEKYKKYGRLYGSFEGNTPHLSVAEPEHIKTMFVKDFHVFHSASDISTGCPMLDLMMAIQQGENWKRVRAIVTPTFTSGKLRKMSPLVQDLVEKFLQDLLIHAEHETAIDFLKQYNLLTLAVIARCFFGTKFENLTDENHPFIKYSKLFFSPSSAYRLILNRFFPKLVQLLKIETFPSDILNYYKNIAKSIMDQRKQMKQEGSDFLQIILDAQEGKLDMTEEDPAEQSHFDVGGNDSISMKSSSKKKFVSEDEALAQCVMFLIGGVDTAASALAVISYDLALNPDCQNKLIKEVDAFWGGMKGELDLTELNRLPYLDSVISESLRIHTLAARMERVAQEDYVLADKGIRIPKGTLVTVPVAAMHNDPEWFPQPETYDPERFSPENKKTIDPYTFLPFGAGPRNCVAMRFALLQIKLCMVHMLQHIRFLRSALTKVPLDRKRAGVLEIPAAVILNIEKRQKAK